MNQNNDKRQVRPPIVVVVGHVDHGKTSLLDYIRKTNVAGKEAGGITQSIGAYEIFHSGRKITFIDTPGHEAFSKMRERGAHIADVAILVVAADEGVKPQTKEAIKVLRDSETPFVVALTKIDKAGADINRVKNELSANDVLLEGYGGKISFQGVSSKTGEGVNDLLDIILLTADVEELIFDATALASGVVLEAKMDKQRGNSVTAILRDGILRKGDLIATHSAKGKIKILENFLGEPVSEFYPSSPAVILGFEALPQIGEEFKAGKLSEEELEAVKAKKIVKTIGKKAKEEQTVRLILKADVSGSLEVLHDFLRKIPIAQNQKLDIISQSVGEISDGDVKDAIATDAMIIGFRVRPNKAAENIARIYDVKIVTDEIIYKLVEGIEKMFLEMKEGKHAGGLEILAVFSAKGALQTIGGRVNKGKILNKAWLEIRRSLSDHDEEIIGKGKVVSLQQAKKDTNAVSEGNECGLLFDSEIKIQVGDILLAK